MSAPQGRADFAGRAILVASLLCMTATGFSQELIYQEDFETDGEAATPQRYTTVGRDVYEIDRLRNELGNQDQLGPCYFAHNNEVSYTGVPAPTAGRRMIMAWDLVMTEGDTSPEMLRLFDSAIKWLLNDKTGAKIVVTPAATALGVLGERLTAAGHTLVDDDITVPDEQLTTLGDMLFHAGGGSRGARAAFPMLVINSPDADDVLTSSIGTATAYQPGPGTVAAPNHPAAGGLTGTFTVANASFTWQLMGDILPENATVLATFTQSVPPTVASLADVDAMIAGTKPSSSSSGQVAALDFNDASEGNWPGGEALPGSATGIWGLRAVGKITVSEASTFTIASGADDGVRVRIDLNRNGIDAGDTIINDPGPHGHTIIYGDVVFPAAGDYDIEVVAYNSGAGGDTGVSVAINAGGGKTGLDTDSSNWELLGTAGAVSSVKAQGTFQVTSYTPTGADQSITRPLVMLLNGPNDTPPGSVFGGGPFTGQSGQRFVAGAGMNKWTLPDTADRYLTLRPINVAGKSNLKLTIALAGTFLDFERSALTRGSADYIEVVVDTDGSGPKDFERLMFFTPPTGNDKFVDDATTRASSPTRLGLGFKDVTYDIPAGATDLIVEVRTVSTWWNEIFAFDNIRITSGAVSTPPTLGKATITGTDIVLTWTGGQAPFLVQGTPALPGGWVNLVTTSANTATIPLVGGGGFFRVQNNATGTTAKLYKALLSGATEVPPVPESQGRGSALIAVEGDNLTYYVSYGGLTGAAVAAHIHGPASATESAAPMFNLTPVPAFGASGVLVGTHVLTAAEKTALKAGQTYVNIHTGNHGGGEIRGQVSLAQ